MIRLDLSFNCIKRVRGLETLVNLSDLTLSNNQIEKVEGINHLKELVFLSLHNNKIARLGEMIKHLLGLPKLQVLNCSGNDFIKDKDNYVEYLVHYMHGLKYINSQYVEKMKTTGGEDKYKLDELEEKLTDLNKKKEENVVIDEKAFLDNQLGVLIRYDDKLLDPEVRDYDMITLNEEIFEMPRNTLKEAVRLQCNTSLELIKLNLRFVQENIDEFNRALKVVEEKSHEKILGLIQVYFKKKKLAKLNWEDHKGDWRQEIKDLLHWMHNDFNRDLMWVESDFIHTTGKVVTF